MSLHKMRHSERGIITHKVPAPVLSFAHGIFRDDAPDEAGDVDRAAELEIKLDGVL